MTTHGYLQLPHSLNSQQEATLLLQQDLLKTAWNFSSGRWTILQPSALRFLRILTTPYSPALPMRSSLHTELLPVRFLRCQTGLSDSSSAAKGMTPRLSSWRMHTDTRTETSLSISSSRTGSTGETQAGTQWNSTKSSILILRA